jgi:tetratricopeptide (TPR) repeat protein
MKTTTLIILFILLLSSCNFEKDSVSRGELLLENLEYEKAIEVFSNCLKTDSHDPLALSLRASTYMEINKFDLAIVDLESAYQIDSTLSHMLVIYGSFYKSIDSNELARDYFKKALIYDSANILAYNNPCADAIDEGKFNLAKVYIDKAISLNPKGSLLFINLAVIYWNLNLNDSAKINFTRSTSTAMSKYQRFYAWLARGKFYRDIGEPEKAIEDFTKAIELNQRSGQIFYERGLAYVRIKEYELAYEDLLIARRLKINQNIDGLIEEAKKLIKTGA